MMPREQDNWMWAEACQLLEQAERLHRRFFEFHRLAASQLSWEPPVDVIEKRQTFSITVALPGVSPETIEVAVADSILVISGVRALPLDGDTTAIHRLEIPYGRFERAIPLPAGPVRVGDPVYAHGCITLQLYKTG